MAISHIIVWGLSKINDRNVWLITGNNGWYPSWRWVSVSNHIVTFHVLQWHFAGGPVPIRAASAFELHYFVPSEDEGRLFKSCPNLLWHINTDAPLSTDIIETTVVQYAKYYCKEILLKGPVLLSLCKPNLGVLFDFLVLVKLMVKFLDSWRALKNYGQNLSGSKFKEKFTPKIRSKNIYIFFPESEFITLFEFWWAGTYCRLWYVWEWTLNRKRDGNRRNCGVKRHILVCLVALLQVNCLQIL